MSYGGDLDDVEYSFTQHFMSWVIKAVNLSIQVYVFMHAWLWFVVPAGVYPLNIFHACGIVLAVKVITFHIHDYKKDSIEDMTKFANEVTIDIMTMVVSLFAWGLMYVISLF